MNKFLSTLILMASSICMYSQNTTVENGQDFHLMYQSEVEAYGIQGALDLNDNFCFTGSVTSNLKFGEGDNTFMTMIFGVGVKRRIVFSDVFLFQAKLYPYLGYGNTKVVTAEHNTGIGTYHERKESNEFLYGAAADAQVGFKLWDNSNGKTYLSVGYQICAGKFKTEGLFKYGNIMAGITIII